jgi:hypothetical protein
MLEDKDGDVNSLVQTKEVEEKPTLKKRGWGTRPQWPFVPLGKLKPDRRTGTYGTTEVVP